MLGLKKEPTYVESHIESLASISQPVTPGPGD